MIRKFGSIAGIEMQPSGLDVGLGGSNVKSVQRGSATLATELTDITITSVNPLNSIVLIAVHPAGAETQERRIFAKGKVTTATNLNLSLTLFGSSIYVSWQVIEFQNLKSLQKGEQTISAATTNVTISSVNRAKSFVYCNYNSSSADASFISALITYELTTSTNLYFEQGNTAGKSVQWYVVEFN